MFRLFGRKAKPPRAVRKSVIRNRAKYQVVESPDSYNRPRGHVETEGEDRILSAYGRGRMLALARGAARNSSTLNSLLTTLCQNVVGTTGGKVILPWDADKQIIRPFARFTQNADFFDGISFNELLRLVLITNILGGNTVAIFDNGLVTDSGTPSFPGLINFMHTPPRSSTRCRSHASIIFSRSIFCSTPETLYL